jgi:hypothetical protein
MRKAGVNPMLAISQGGASTPSGSMAQVQPEFDSQTMLNSITTAQQAKVTDETVKKIASDTELNKVALEVQKAQAVKLEHEGTVASANAEKAKLESDFYRKNPEFIKYRMFDEGGSATKAKMFKDWIEGLGSDYKKRGYGPGEIPRKVP